MKNRQVRFIIGVLVALVLFSSSLAFLFYAKQEQKSQSVQENIEVFVASKRLNAGEIIAASDLQKAFLPKSYIEGVPLTEAEIIGRYASVDIFAKELFRKEKISLLEPEPQISLPQTDDENKTRKKKQEQAPKELRDTVTLPLSLFQNLDTRLKKGDAIDIVSTLAKNDLANLNRGEREFKTKYIAMGVTINTFINGANKTNTLASLDSESKLTYAEAVVLEMDPKEIKNFFGVYYKTQELNSNRVYNATQANKGHLWMIKCAQESNATTQSAKEQSMVDYIVVQTKKAAQKKAQKAKEQVSISYEE